MIRSAQINKPSAGLLDLRRAQEWVVTTKLGSSDKRPGTGAHDIRQCKLYAGEAAMSMFVLSAAIYGIVTVNRWTFSVFLMLQGAHPCCAIQLVPHCKKLSIFGAFHPIRFNLMDQLDTADWIRQTLLYTLQMLLHAPSCTHFDVAAAA